MVSKSFYVYIISSSRTKRRYIGCTRRTLKKRFNEHKRSNSLIGRRMRHIGVKTFRIRVLKKLDNIKDMFKIERYFINKLNTKKNKGYNVS